MGFHQFLFHWKVVLSNITVKKIHSQTDQFQDISKWLLLKKYDLNSYRIFRWYLFILHKYEKDWTIFMNTKLYKSRPQTKESYFRNPLLLLSFAAYNCIKVICRVFRFRHKCPVIKVKFKSDNCRNCQLSSGLEHLFLGVNVRFELGSLAV